MNASDLKSSSHALDKNPTHRHIEAVNFGSAVEERSLTILNTIKRSPFAIGYSLLVIMGAMVYGFDLMVVGLVVAMPSFQVEFGSIINGTHVIPALWLALWTSMLQLGAMVGALASGSVSNRFGRRVATGLGALVVAVGVAAAFFADRCETLEGRRVLFLMGKIVEGSGLAIMNATCITLISEFVPTRIRGPILSCFTLFTIVGQIIGVSSVFARITSLDKPSYHVVLGVQWALAAFMLFVAFVIPESPIYLIRRDNLNHAVKAYRRLHPKADAGKEVASLQIVVKHEIAAQKTQSISSILQCFKGTNFRRTRIIMYAYLLQQLVGVTMVSYATYFLELAGMSPTLVLTLTLIEFVLGIPSIIASWFTMTIFGRRAILLVGSFVSAALWLAMGIAGCFPRSPAALWFMGVSLIVIFVVYCLSVGAAYPVVGGETSSVDLRAASQSVGFCTQFFFGWLFSFTVPYMFDVDAGNLGGKVGFIFAVLSALATAIVWFEVPEMKNRTFAELDEMFERKIPTRKFKDFVCEGMLFTAMSEETTV